MRLQSSSVFLLMALAATCVGTRDNSGRKSGEFRERNRPRSVKREAKVDKSNDPPDPSLVRCILPYLPDPGVRVRDAMKVPFYFGGTSLLIVVVVTWTLWLAQNSDDVQSV